MKEHLKNNFGNACPSLVRSIVQRIEGGTSSQPIISQAPETPRCGPEAHRNHTNRATASQNGTSHILTNRNSVAATHRNGNHSVTDPGSANTKGKFNDESNSRRLSLSDTTPKSDNVSSLQKKFRSTENLLNARPAGNPNTSRPTSAANSRAQGSLPTGSGRTADLKDSGHRRVSETGAGVTCRSRSRSIDAPSSSSAPRSRSVEARSRTPLRSSVNVTSGPTPPAFRTSRASVPAAVVCDSVADKQVVVLSRTVAKRQSLTTSTTESSSIVPDRKGLQQKLSSARLGITADKLLPNYQPKRKLQSSVSFDASVVDSRSGVETGDLRRSSSLHESATMPILTVTFEDYPEPPPPEEDLNAKMELLFEEYRQIELGLIFKKNHPEELQENKESDKNRPVERGRRRVSTDRCSQAAPAQNRRVRSVSLDRSFLTESRTSNKEMLRAVTPRSDAVQSAVRDSRTPAKKLDLSQENSKTRVGSARLSTTRPSSSALATVPVCSSNVTDSVVTRTQASSISTKTLEDPRNRSNNSSDNLHRLLHDQNGNRKIQNSSSEHRVPTRDPSLTQSLRRSSTTDLSSRAMEDRSGTNATGNSRISRDMPSCNVTNKRIAVTTDPHHTLRDVPSRNILNNRRTTTPDITTATVRKPTETGSGKPDIRSKQLNGNKGGNNAANVVPTTNSEKFVEHGVEQKEVTASTKETTSKDERAGPRSKIPVPIYSKKFCSGSQRSLKRCDSGVDIANNYKPEADCVGGLRMGHDEEPKSNAPLILNPVTSRLICGGCTATNTLPDVEDEYY